MKSVTLETLHDEIDALKFELDKIRSEIKRGTLGVSDEIAEKLIVSFITKKRAEGVAEVDVLDIADALRLPFDQISRVLNTLKSRGIREIE
jgi:predicted transcriptional regulator